jgi:DHA1 family multidrug resistance protein-like MFS transporter
MGLSNSFVSLGRVAGPIFAGLIFDINPNFPYLAGALILCIVFAISMVWLREETNTENSFEGD